MSNYEICKKWIAYRISDNPNNFLNYANITREEFANFYKFMNNKYNCYSAEMCQQYIDKCNKQYIKEKVNELL